MFPPALARPSWPAALGGGNCSQYWLEEDGMPDPSLEPTKPPYRVPLMTEIEAVPANGFKVVSTFSGCGGSSLGFRMAGYRVVWANEVIGAARQSYRLNNPDCFL